jgi:hypothetical protein
MPGKTKIYAVLTGDLVKSSKLSVEQSRKAIELLKRRAGEFEKTFQGAIQGELDSFRHDSWQLLMKRPALAIRATIFLRASVKMQSDATTRFDTRIAIGIGTVDSISRRRISDSRGAAFTLSGKALDAMNGQHLAFASENSLAGDCIAQGMIPLLDCVISDWTATESRAVHGALLGRTQEQSAAKWPVDQDETPPSRQAVAKALRRARWITLERVLNWVERNAQPQEVA